MVDETKRRPGLLENDEPLLPASGWGEEPGWWERAGALRRDLVKCAREAAEAKFAAGEAEKAAHEHRRKELLALLEITDAFERVFRAIESKKDLVNRQMKKWIGNFRTVYRMLGALLAREGVARMENLAEGFDPHWHKAVETIADPSQPDGTIVEEVQAGYMWRSEVLRKAEVKVVRNADRTQARPQAHAGTEGGSDHGQDHRD